jgi:mannose-6-phosphate isomerase-like protein (cupin superfamily)
MIRDASSGEDGSVRLANMRAGTYRFRFTREGSITLERDVTIRGGEPVLVDVSLSAAPVVKPQPVEEAPKPTPEKMLGPPGEPKLLDVGAFLEKNLINRGQKDTPFTCSSTGIGTVTQAREPLVNQVHNDPDEWIYVVAGQGMFRLAGSTEREVKAGTLLFVPHTATHGFVPSGRYPMVFLSVLSGYRTC